MMTVRNYFQRKLGAFRSSGRNFEIICEASRTSAAAGLPREVSTGSRSGSRPRRLIILDSSFNPPTQAHLFMAAGAIRDIGQQDTRLLLLLAINNADKPPKPESFEQRLAMMNAFASDLHQELAGGGGDGGGSGASGAITAAVGSSQKENNNSWHDGGGDGDGFGIDIALTNHPYFHEKSDAIAEALEALTGAQTDGSTEQTFLVGYDTLIRIFNPRYYTSVPANPAGEGSEEASNPMQQALSPLFQRARLRISMRADGDWGGRQEQLAFVAGVKSGDLLAEAGGRREWASRIDIVERPAGRRRTASGEDQGGSSDNGNPCSSTLARDAARRQDWQRLGELVPRAVLAWIREEGLYQENSAS